MSGKNDSKAQKKLPKRADSSHRKHARRGVWWIEQQFRKASRRRIQDAAAARNRRLRANGELTPWELAKAKRREARN